MHIHVHVHQHGEPWEKVLKELQAMTVQLQALQAQVAKNTEIEESAVTLIKGLADQITALKDDPAALEALAASLTTSAGDLSKAITDNTAPPAPVPPAA